MEFFRLLLEECLFHFHLTFNDWGLAIIALALAIRLVLFPVQFFNFFQQRRLHGIQPEIERLTADFKDDPPRAFREIQELKKRAGVKTWTMFVLGFAQIPIFLSMYKALSSTRNFSEVSFLWISNLATPDAFYILPLAVAVTTYFQFKNHAPAGKPQPVLVSRLVPAVNFVFMAAMPSALVLYYAASGLFQFVSETALRRIVV